MQATESIEKKTVRAVDSGQWTALLPHGRHFRLQHVEEKRFMLNRLPLVGGPWLGMIWRLACGFIMGSVVWYFFFWKIA